MQKRGPPRSLLHQSLNDRSIQDDLVDASPLFQQPVQAFQSMPSQLPQLHLHLFKGHYQVYPVAIGLSTIIAEATPTGIWVSTSDFTSQYLHCRSILMQDDRYWLNDALGKAFEDQQEVAETKIIISSIWTTFFKYAYGICIAVIQQLRLQIFISCHLFHNLFRPLSGSLCMPVLPTCFLQTIIYTIISVPCSKLWPYNGVSSGGCSFLIHKDFTERLLSDVDLWDSLSGSLVRIDQLAFSWWNATVAWSFTTQESTKLMLLQCTCFSFSGAFLAFLESAAGLAAKARVSFNAPDSTLAASWGFNLSFATRLAYWLSWRCVSSTSMPSIIILRIRRAPSSLLHTRKAFDTSTVDARISSGKSFQN